MAYALFFDIDGTLVSFKTHEIPPSTILALTQAKANGHRIYIATGRPINIITNLGAIEHLVDGYVTTNGARCFVGEETVLLNAIPAEEARFLVDDARQKGYSMVIVGERDIALLDSRGDIERIFHQGLAVNNLGSARPVEEVMQQPILQLSPFFDADYERTIMPHLPNCTSGRWHPEFTDITSRKADKRQGLLAMARHEGIDPAHTIAFGDGGNDTSMIVTAAIGIAMGNAIDELKQRADYITTSVDDDGILLALRHFGIIQQETHRRRLVVFDFDGTLADTRRTIVTTMQQTLAELGLPAAAEEACIATIGLPLRECFRQVVSGASEETLDACADTYRRLFEANKERLRPVLFPHVEETVRRLAREGVRMTVASSRTKASLVDLLTGLGLIDCFEYILGADDVTHAKPHPEPVLHTLRALGIEARQALVVGDMPVDIMMGAGAGCQTCGVTYGNATREELEAAGADFIIDDMSQLTV